MGVVLEKEVSKYERIWDFAAYKEESPGVHWLEKFLRIVQPEPGASIVDIGAGAGAASRLLKDKGFDVIGIDLVSTAWEHKDIKLVKGTLWDHVAWTPIDVHYGFCCDVMEHIPTEYVGLVVDNILNHVNMGCFFSISFMPDNGGKLIGEQLHLTIKPFTWWRDLFRELGTLEDARDLPGMGLFYVS